jgi:hypothetical protein
MTTKRIRCGCGRVYDPVKRPSCPDCGAPHVVAEPPEPIREKREETPPTKPLSIPPRMIALGAALLLLLVVVIGLNRCGGKEKPTPQPSPSPSVAAVVPNETPAITKRQEPTPAPNEQRPSPSAAVALTEESDLAALVARAAPGATVQIPPGTYPGGLTLTRPIHLVVDRRRDGQVVIQSSGTACLTVQSKGVSVQAVQFICNGIGQLPAITVAEGAELQLEGCQVQTPTAFGVSLNDKAMLKAVGSSFTAAQGTAVRLDRGAEATLSQCLLGDSRDAFYAGGGARLEVHSCAFQRNGGDNGLGVLFAVNGEGTQVMADDCQFESNAAGAVIGEKAALTVTNSRFKNNEASASGGKGVDGLISVRLGAHATLKGDTFEANRQGVYIAEGGSLEMDKCQFAGNGVQSRQLIPGAFPVSISGQNSSAVIRHTTLADSLQYAMEVRGGAKLTLEDVEITGSRDVGLIVGDRNSPPATAEIKHCRFDRNLTGLGIFGGSSATMEDSEYHENQQAILIFDHGSRLTMTTTKFVGNNDYGLHAYASAQVTASDCDFRNNARGVLSGSKGRAAERASVTLENCRFGGNRVFGAGAAMQSELILTKCVFDGSDKTNTYKERGANIQTNDAPVQQPSPTPPADAETSPTPEESVEPSPSPESSVGPSPDRKKSTPRPRRKPTPRPRPPTPEDIRRALQRLLPGGN